MERREFIGTSLIAALGTSLIHPTKVFSNPNFEPINQELDYVASLSSFLWIDDFHRLLQVSDLSEDIRKTLHLHYEYFQLGMGWKVSSQDLLAIGNHLKGQINESTKEEWFGQKVSLWFGLLANKTYTNSVKENSKILEDIEEADAYRTCHIVKMVQNFSHQENKIPINAALNKDAYYSVKEGFRLIRERNLIRMHTFKAEFSDAEKWIGQVIDLHHKSMERDVRYAKIYCNPDSRKVKEYIIVPNFYDEHDTIIKRTREIQKFNVAGNVDLAEIIASEAKSQYAKALQTSCRIALAYDKYLKEKISEAEWEKLLGQQDR